MDTGRARSPMPPRATLKRALQVSSGNLFEAFDLIVFGTFSRLIADNFFPVGNSASSLMLALSTFASGYVMRFLGAVTLGPYFDHAGRRKGLLVSFGLMAAGTGLIAIIPTYRQAGLLGPALLIAARLTQGFSAGAETGGLSAYLLEIAPPNRNAFYVSWNATSFLFATLLATGLAFGLQHELSAEAMGTWGWRIPFLLGCCVIPLIFLLRRTLPESEAFDRQSRHLTMSQVLIAVVRNWRIAIVGMLMTVFTSCMFYFIFIFIPVFEKESLHLLPEDTITPAIATIVYSIAMIAAFSVLSDRIGRFPLIAASTLLTLLTAYPVLHHATSHPSFHRLFLAQLWFATLYTAHSSSSFVGLTELVPARIRATGYGVTTTLGLAIFGGSTPLVSIWLAQATGNQSAPAVWLMFVAACSLVAAYILFVRTIAVRDGSDELPPLMPAPL